MTEYPTTNSLDIAEKWAQNVLKKKVIVADWVYRAVKRDAKDQKQAGKRGLWFDEQAAARILEFFLLLRHTKGEYEGYNFVLAPFQQWMLSRLFGWKYENGNRRFRYAYIEMAKKNGKSALAAGVGLYLLACDNEAESEVYSSATHSKQAKIVFDQAHSFMNKLIFDVPYFRINFECFRHNIHSLRDKSKFEALGKDRNDSTDGRNPNGNIIDEYHAWTHNDQSLFKSLKTATVGRRQPLTFIITTAGSNKDGPCYEYRTYVTQVLKGLVQDDSLFGMIMTLDEGDDWRDEKVWVKANPNLGMTPKLENLRGELVQALKSPTEERNFKTKHLNIWVNASKGWLPEDDYKKNQHGTDIAVLDHKFCYGGLDLAKGTDLNAFAQFFDKEDTGLPYHAVKCAFWIPEHKLEQTYDNVPYQDWVDQGYLQVMPGRTIKADQISKYIEDSLQVNEMRNMGFDPYISHHGTVQYFEDHALEINPIRQGFLTLSAPTKELESILVEGQLETFDNPILAWMFSNIEIEMDAAGNIKMSKKLSKQKIDGWSAIVNAMAVWMSLRNQRRDSIYEENDLMIL